MEHSAHAPAYEPPVVRIPLPADFSDEKDADVLERAKTLCLTAEHILALMVESGQTPSITEDDREISRRLFDGTTPLSHIPASVPTGIALHLAGLLNQYDVTVVQSAEQLRNLCTNILIEKATKGKTEQVQLRAVEMIGKIKDVGLFEERSTVLVEHMTTDDIKSRLKEKIGRLSAAAATATDVTLTAASLIATETADGQNKE